MDEQGNLEATASDALTGESQSLSVSLKALAGGPSEYPEFELEREGGGDFEETLLTGETYPISAADRRKEHLGRKRRSPLLLIGLVLLSLILIAAIMFVVFRAVGGTPIPPLFAGRSEAALTETAAAGAPAAGAPADQSAGEQAAEQPAEPVPAGSGEGQAAALPEGAAAQAEGAAAGTGGGVWYQIKWGDTLWDIAATYYRNPWLYPRIARENRITNPDLIFAGTRIFIPEN